MSLPIKRYGFFRRNWYEITNGILGQGSFSTVYLARHSVFKNKVALKVIDKNNIKEEYVLKNLHREASILMKLNHPNIVNFYEELSYHDLYCLSMEYVNGVDLCRYLKNQPDCSISEEVARIFFYQMVAAINHMHNLNVLHRDLKQENVLVEFGRVIKIIDFGLSNVYHPTVQLRTHCGSFVYAAPELFETHSTYGAAVDLWSLGIILYSMLVGKMPFGLPKSKDKSLNESSKGIFLQRIAQGLTQSNRNHMKNLTYDCCHLVENLLQPNQFKRLIIKDAIAHPWFENNPQFKKKLPQQRLDLVQNFRSEIIDFMADKMKISTEKIEHHLLTFPYSRISAVYFVAKDTLIKEVLYPPREIRRSFLFEMECRRKAAHLALHLEDCDSNSDDSSSSCYDDGGGEGDNKTRRNETTTLLRRTSVRRSAGDFEVRRLPLVRTLKKGEMVEKYIESIGGRPTGDGKSVSFDERSSRRHQEPPSSSYNSRNHNYRRPLHQPTDSTASSSFARVERKPNDPPSSSSYSRRPPSEKNPPPSAHRPSHNNRRLLMDASSSTSEKPKDPPPSYTIRRPSASSTTESKARMRSYGRPVDVSRLTEQLNKICVLDPAKKDQPSARFALARNERVVSRGPDDHHHSSFREPQMPSAASLYRRALDNNTTTEWRGFEREFTNKKVPPLRSLKVPDFQCCPPPFNHQKQPFRPTTQSKRYKVETTTQAFK